MKNWDGGQIDFMKKLSEQDSITVEYKQGDDFQVKPEALVITVSNTVYHETVMYKESALRDRVLNLDFTGVNKQVKVSTQQLLDELIKQENKDWIIMKALALEPEIFKQTRRGGEASKLLETEKPIFLMEWILDNIISVPNEKLKRTKIHSSYNEAVNNKKTQNPKRNFEEFNTDSSFYRAFEECLQQLEPCNYVKQTTSHGLFFENINFATLDDKNHNYGKLTPIIRPDVIEAFKKNPLAFSNLSIPDSKGKRIKGLALNPKISLNTYDCLQKIKNKDIPSLFSEGLSFFERSGNSHLSNSNPEKNIFNFSKEDFQQNDLNFQLAITDIFGPQDCKPLFSGSKELPNYFLTKFFFSKFCFFKQCEDGRNIFLSLKKKELGIEKIKKENSDYFKLKKKSNYLQLSSTEFCNSVEYHNNQNEYLISKVRMDLDYPKKIESPYFLEENIICELSSNKNSKNNNLSLLSLCGSLFFGNQTNLSYINSTEIMKMFFLTRESHLYCNLFKE